MLKRMQHKVQEAERLREITLTVHPWVPARREAEQLSALSKLHRRIHLKSHSALVMAGPRC